MEFGDAALANGRMDCGLAVRHACRSGGFDGPTTGLAPGFVQANLAILPRDWAEEFLDFCIANPKPCPLLGIAQPGDPGLPALGADLDIRTDLGRYRVWRDGELVDEPADIAAAWRDDLVTFAIGCSFSFEEPLIAAGVPVRHIAYGRNVAMYRTTIETTPAGRFHGPLVVSMRPLRPADAIRAVEITSRLPAVHGAPIHLGFPEAIGIHDLATPDFGDAVPIEADELPVFWACGVTPQIAIAAARPPFAITHAPGRMLVTDLRNAQLAAL
jgi:uncharacterized protein YcsI (UPF0317 family)